MSETTPYDIAIVGSGCSGSILARILNRLGYRALLIEKGQHPRFALGESTTPLANLVLERLARRYDLPDLHHLSTHGRWRRHLPKIRHGIKRGFSFYHHRRDQPFRNSEANEARLLVAASPDELNADTHWLRSDVDQHLVERARQEGVTYRDRTAIDDVQITPQGVVLSGERGGKRVRYRADFLIDATGPQGVLARTLKLRQRPCAMKSALLFAHFETSTSWRETALASGAALPSGPYPDDQAAVHHLLDAGWMYALPFQHGVTSAGILLRAEAHRGLIAKARRSPRRAWREFLAAYPTLEAQFSNARPTVPLRLVENVQHRLSRATGRRWFLLPHTYAFFDPMFSTGIAWSLLAIERLASWFADPDTQTPEQIARRYDHLLAKEADQIERLIELAWSTMPSFDLFTQASFLYFAPVSFAEVRQRLNGHSDPWDGFLGANDAALVKLFLRARRQLYGLLERSGKIPGRAFSAWVQRQIVPYNIAGLADPGKRNLYPLDLEVLVDRAHLLGMTSAELRRLLPRLRGDTSP